MIKSVGIIANPNKKKALKYQKDIKGYLSKRDITVYTDRESSRKDIVEKTDLIITLGGDGTLLNIVKFIKKKVEVLGVNVGGFGFLTEVKTNEVYSVLDDILNNNYSVSLRRMIKASVHREGKIIETLTSLNDMVINKGSLSRILTLSLSVEDETVATYLCDGLIVSSSTGSTAHSLSAGGPIVTPNVDALIVTAICPHTLTNRPLVLPSSKKIKVKILGKNTQDVALTADGQVAVKLKFNDTLIIKRAPISLRLIVSKKRSYFQVLREKLKWGRLR